MTVADRAEPSARDARVLGATRLRHRLPVIAIALLFLASASAAAVYGYRTRLITDPLADLLVTQAKVGDIEEMVQATGSIRPVRIVAVGSRVSGRVVIMNAPIGKRFRAGDLIAEIDSVTQQNDLETAEAALDDVRAQRRQKEASLAYAEQALTREEKTLAREATSRDSWEQARATVETTRAQTDSLAAQIKEAEVKVANARVQLDYTRIIAPIDGTVLLVSVQEGRTVNAVQSAPTLVVLGQIDRMLVRAEISEADAPKVKVGQNATFSILGDPERQWEATLLSLDPAPDSLRTDAEIASSDNSSTTSSSAIYYYNRFLVDNPDGVLRTYMTAQVRIVLAAAKGVVTVPTAAVSSPNEKGERTVDVVNGDGSRSQRVVQVGIDDKVRTEIRNGLDAGERIVAGRRVADSSPSAMPAPPGGL